MLKIGVIGAGHHSRTFHLPALAHYRTLNPGAIELVVLCDRDPERAKLVAAGMGFQHACTDYREMAHRYSLDGCLLLTPPAATLETAQFFANHTAAALLVEKPLGENVAQAHAFIASIDRLRTQAMVSMNRRFDPWLHAALGWIGEREITHLQVTMTRVARTEPQFMWTTGLHVVDAVIAILGEPSTSSIRSRSVDGVSWHFLSLRSGLTSVQIDIMPTAGNRIEHFEFFGADFTVSVRTGQNGDCGWRAWQNDRLVSESSSPANAPAFLVDGTYEETEAFLAAIRGERAFYPTPSAVRIACEICAEFKAIS